MVQPYHRVLRSIPYHFCSMVHYRTHRRRCHPLRSDRKRLLSQFVQLKPEDEEDRDKNRNFFQMVKLQVSKLFQTHHLENDGNKPKQNERVLHDCRLFLMITESVAAPFYSSVKHYNSINVVLDIFNLKIVIFGISILNFAPQLEELITQFN